MKGKKIFLVMGKRFSGGVSDWFEKCYFQSLSIVDNYKKSSKEAVSDKNHNMKRKIKHLYPRGMR